MLLGSLFVSMYAHYYSVTLERDNGCIDNGGDIMLLELFKIYISVNSGSTSHIPFNLRGHC